MFLFNKLVNQFIEKQKARLKEICDECHIGLYPVKIVVYNKSFKEKQTIGFYNHNQRLIALHQSLMLEPQEKVDEILKHEYAHFLSIKNHGEDVQSHGKEFAFFCKRLGISAAAVDEDPLYYEKVEKNNILEKIKKLLDLGSSPNEHEAELATAKANQLLMKYNLSLDNLPETDEIYMHIVAQAPKANTFIQELQSLMTHFNVYAITTRRNRVTFLEIAGDRVNVEIATYVADFFTREHIRLWNIAKKEHGLKGLRDKNSFIWGLVRGFCSKINKAKKESLQEEDIKTLTVYNKRVAEQAKKFLYKNARTVRYNQSGSATAADAGHDAGSKMNISPGIKYNSGETKLLK